MKPIKQLLEDNQIAYTEIEPVKDEVFAGMFKIDSVKGYRVALPPMGRMVSIQCGVGTFTVLGRKGHYFNFRGSELMQPLQAPYPIPSNWYEVAVDCEIASWLPEGKMQMLNGDTVEGGVTETELVAFLKRITELDADAFATGEDLTALLAGVFDS